MAKFIITVEGGKITQTLNYLDRNVKENRYIYENGNESGITEDPEEVYSDIPESYRITEKYKDLLDTINLGKTQITETMRRLNELEKEMEAYDIPEPENAREHVISLSNRYLEKLSKMFAPNPPKTDKQIEEAIKELIHKGVILRDL